MPAALRVVSLPADPPVALADVKKQLRVDYGDDDLFITAMIKAAALDAGAECGRGFGVASYAVTLDAFPGFPAGWAVGWAWAPGAAFDPHLYPWAVSPRVDLAVPLPVRPVVSVDAVRYRDETGALVTMDPAAYWPALQTGRVLPAAGYWPPTQLGRPEAVEVAFTAGHPADALPPQAWQAILLILGDRWEHRGDDDDDRRPIPEAARRLLMQLHDGRIV